MTRGSACVVGGRAVRHSAWWGAGERGRLSDWISDPWVSLRCGRTSCTAWCVAWGRGTRNGSQLVRFLLPALFRRLPTCRPCDCRPQVQPHAEAFGRACKLEPSKVANFGEEVVRGQPLFLVSQLLQVRHVY